MQDHAAWVHAKNSWFAKFEIEQQEKIHKRAQEKRLHYIS